MGLTGLFHIGAHARDVLGRQASACQTLQWVIDAVVVLEPRLTPWPDPWGRSRTSRSAAPWSR